MSTAPVAVKTDPTLEVPPLAELDPFIRQLLGALSPRPELARWLATDDLAGHLAAGIAQVAGGATPAKDFASLRPAGKFSVAGRGDRRVIADSSFRRYDGLAATVASVDAASAARAYRILAQRLQEAYAAQGRRGRVDEDVRAGLDRLVDTPVPDGPIAVRPGRGNTWAFADPGLERLSAAQKQLLRMGPDNARAVQQKLREIRDALSTAASP